jgi:integrase/recombinase XerD
LLDKYIKGFKLSKNAGVNAFLFQGSLSKPLTRQRIFQLIKNTAKRAGVDCDIVSPHSFRHRMLTDLVEGNADLVSVQKIAGHKQINTTARYIHLDDRVYLDIIEKHPLTYIKKNKLDSL